MSKAAEMKARLDGLADEAQAKVLRWFFKTGPGEYGEGDEFIGLKVPTVRRVVREFRGIAAREAAKLVQSAIHEHRLAGLLCWVDAYERGDRPVRDEIIALYLANTRHVNNWDLVDLSAPQIVGGSFPADDTTFLETLAESPLLWERRIAVLATLAYIRQGEFAPTLTLCEMLMADRHDLMHKACGWMLREVGKRDRSALEAFLDRHAATMPRTMLRYSLEHFPAGPRARYMAMKSKALLS